MYQENNITLWEGRNVKKSNISVMILAGGLGTRLREETEFRPKPMVPIGGKPIIWHLMKIYSHYGFYRFIICLGYKGEMIKDYFFNYHIQGVDFTVNTKTGTVTELISNDEEWEITLVDTGQDCMTGGRIARAAKYVDTNTFLFTYGDGLADINISDLVKFHENHGKLITLTGTNMFSRFGNLDIVGNQVISFKEKNKLEDEWINGGFFVCNKEFLKYLTINDDCVLEQEPLRNVAKDGQLMIYKHYGFWQCMDTLREQQYLEQLWAKGAPWKIWQDTDRIFTPAHKEQEKKIYHETHENLL